MLAEVLFLLGLAAIEAAGRPGIAEAEFNRFLSEIRARRRWSLLSVGFALAPDSNIGAASDERIIYIVNLPFHRDAEELTTSGIGLAVWGGGEYQHPLGERLRLCVSGIDAGRREYPARNFDQFYLSGYAGPRWLMDARTEVSLLASARQVWVGPAPSHRDHRRAGGGDAPARPADDGTRARVMAPARIPDPHGAGRPDLRCGVPRRLDDHADGAVGGVARLRPRAPGGGAVAQHQPASGGRCLGCPDGGIHRGRRRLTAVDGVPGQLVPVRTRRLLAPGPDADPARLGPPPVVHRVRLQPLACGDERGADDERPGPRLWRCRNSAQVRLVRQFCPSMCRGWHKSIQPMFRRASVGLTEWAVLELGDHDRAIPILGPEARRDRTLGGRIAISNRYFEVFGLMPEITVRHGRRNIRLQTRTEDADRAGPARSIAV